MNEIVAVSPQFFADLRDLSELFGEFGPYNGRYISNFPKDWIAKLREHLNDVKSNLTPLEQERVKLIIAKHKDSTLIDCIYEYNKTQSWPINVKSVQESNNAFNDVIGDVYESDSEFKTWHEKAFEYHENRSRSALLKGTIGENLSVIRPLLKKGPAAYIIDPYFRPTELASEAFLSRIFEEISNSSCFKVVLFIRKNIALSKSNDISKNESSYWTLEEYKKELESSLSRFIKKGKSLVVNLVDERSRKSESLILHNRYFLTKYGAIDFGKGFDKFDYAIAQIPVYIVDRDVHIKLVNWFIDAQAPFGMIDTIEIK